MKLTMKLTFTVIFLLLFTGVGNIAWATPMADISYLEKQLGDDLWQYDFTFTNASDPSLYTGFDLFEVDFNYDEAVSLQGFSLPIGWDLIAGAEFVNVFSILIGPAPTGADIAPGTSQDGFVFQFDTQLGDFFYIAFFTNPSGGDPIVVNGTAAPVAEPATILLVVSGAMGLGLFRKKKSIK